MELLVKGVVLIQYGDRSVIDLPTRRSGVLPGAQSCHHHTRVSLPFGFTVPSRVAVL